MRHRPVPWRGARHWPEFPSYTPGEVAADRLVHGIGLLAAPAATVWLFATLGPAVGWRQSLALAVYCIGLLGMLAASAAYSITGPGLLKARLRRLDRAMIFVMIAGSYTPFAVDALDPAIGMPLCAAVWSLAGTGVSLKIAGVECRERTWVGLYLVLGWLLLPVLPSFVVALPGTVLALLLIGGVIYSLGALIHARASMLFHNALWHAMVLLAAGLHFMAVIRMINSTA